MFLYFVKCNKYVKIGITNDVEKRIKTLQTGNAENLELIRLIEIPDEDAYKIENAIHNRLKEYRVKNEWFELKSIGDILKMSDNEIIGCSKNEKEVYYYKSDPYWKGIFKICFEKDEIVDVVNGYIIFKNKTRNPVRTSDRNYYFSKDDIIDKLKEDYEKYLSEINKEYAKHKEFVDGYQDLLNTAYTNYYTAIESVKNGDTFQC